MSHFRAVLPQVLGHGSVPPVGVSAIVIAPPPPDPDPGTYQEAVLALSPDWYLPLAEASGTTAVAQVGVNASILGNPQLGLPTLAVDDPDGGSFGFSGDQEDEQSLRAETPLTGPDFTLDFIVQFDTLSPAKQQLINIPGSAAGVFAVEMLASGQVRAYSRDNSGVRHEIFGTVGDVSQGTAHKITYQRQSGVSPSQRLLVDGVQVAVDETIRTWATIPVGTVYCCAWTTGEDPLDGLIEHIAGWNSYLAQLDIESLLSVTDSVAWAEDFNGPANIEPETAEVVSVLQGGWHGKLPVVATAGDGSLVTTTEIADEITVTAGVTEGADSFTYSFADANSNVSPTRTISVAVAAAGGGGAMDNEHDVLVMAAPGQVSNVDLQAADFYYWSAETTDALRVQWNDLMAQSGPGGVSLRNNFRDSRSTPEIQVNSKTNIRIAGSSGWNHNAWIEPADSYAAASGEPNAPFGMSQGGVFRHVSRYGSDGEGDDGFGGTWDYNATNVRNFRKSGSYLKRRGSHADYDTGGLTDLHIGKDYEVGFSIWEGGDPGWFRRETQHAIWQVHGASPVQIYFRRQQNATFGGFTSSGSGSTQSFPSFPMQSGNDTIHVLRFQFRLHSSTGFLRIFYQGNQVVNVTGRNIGGNTNNHRLHLLMGLYGSPPDGGNTGEAWIMYSDRVYIDRI